jgi:hypothetical protein
MNPFADIAIQAPLLQQAALIKLSRYGSADEEQTFFAEKNKNRKLKTNQIITYDTLKANKTKPQCTVRCSWDTCSGKTVSVNHFFFLFFSVALK